MAKLYSQALGSLFFAFYDSQVYDEVFNPPPHRENWWHNLMEY
jgi:hypothetical protein